MVDPFRAIDVSPDDATEVMAWRHKVLQDMATLLSRVSTYLDSELVCATHEQRPLGVVWWFMYNFAVETMIQSRSTTVGCCLGVPSWGTAAEYAIAQ
jgi:hypothetical protein